MEKAGYILITSYALICASDDIRTRTISVPVSAVFGTAGIFLSVLLQRGYADLAAALLPGCICIALSLLTRGAIGPGDGIYLGVCGLFLRAPLLAAAFSAALLMCAGAALIILIFDRKGYARRRNALRRSRRKGRRSDRRKCVGYAAVQSADPGPGLPFTAFMLLPVLAAAAEGLGLYRIF